MGTSISIVAAGARTPVGLSAAAAAAAVRAGICRIGEHPFMIDRAGNPMPGALDARLAPSMMLGERLLQLAESALHEACIPLRGPGRVLKTGLPFFLGLPEPRPGFSPQDAELLRSRLARSDKLPWSDSEVFTFIGGHAAGFSALAAAVTHMVEGMSEACLVGGVDSYFHPDTMAWLDENRQLVGAIARSAFVPGEGAGVCLLMTDRARERLGLHSLGGLCSVATGSESHLIKSTDVCLGEGLTDALRRAIAGRPDPDQVMHDVICDINGERYRGEEWGFAGLRLSQYFRDPTAYLCPADCWGDVGAASGPLFMMLACQAVARGYAKGSQALLWASSESGLRGAAVLGFDMQGLYTRRSVGYV